MAHAGLTTAGSSHVHAGFRPVQLQLPTTHNQRWQYGQQRCSTSCSAHSQPGRSRHASSGNPGSGRPLRHLGHTHEAGGAGGSGRPPRADSGRWRSGDGPWGPSPEGGGSPWDLGTSWFRWAALVAAAGSIVCGVVGVVVWCLDQTKAALMTTITVEASSAMQQLRCELRTLTSELRAEMQDLRSHIKQVNSDIKVTMWCVAGLACVVIMLRSKPPPPQPPASTSSRA